MYNAGRKQQIERRRRKKEGQEKFELEMDFYFAGFLGEWSCCWVCGGRVSK